MKDYPAHEWFPTPRWLRRLGPLRFVNASLLDRAGLYRYTQYAALNGILQGAFTLAAVILRKTLGASELEVGIFTAISTTSLLLGIFGAEVSEGKDKRPFVFWFGLISRGAFLLFALATSTWAFIAFSALFFIANALFLPPVFAMWQANVSSAARNRLWGLMVVVTTVITMAAAYATGRLLDLNPWNFRWIMPLAGLLAILGVVTLSRSPLRGERKHTRISGPASLERLVFRPIRHFASLLRSNRHFAQFEGVFFLYGFGLMLLMPVLPVFLVDVAELSYEEVGIAAGILAQVGALVLPPFWGRIMDRTGPQFLCALIFGILALFPLLLLTGMQFTSGLPLKIIVYLAYLIFGAGMAGIHVAWCLGPVAFARDKDSSAFSGAHVTLTGIRGTFGPLLGALGLIWLGYSAVFICSALFFIIGSLGMFVLVKKYGFLKAPQAE